MKKQTINRLVGVGIILFLVGFFLGEYWMEGFHLLIPLGTVCTLTGIFYFFKTTDWVVEFTKDPQDDLITYFWNVLALKIWTFLLTLWMLVMCIELILRD